jgi:Tol biopolymer transport system component
MITTRTEQRTGHGVGRWPLIGVVGVTLAGLLWIPVASAAGPMPVPPTSTCPSISADGRFVAFQSDAPNLVDGDTNNTTDVFVRDTTTGTTTRVNVSGTGEQANQISTRPIISADGTHVLFLSSASNLVPGSGPVVNDLFIRDVVAGTTAQVNVSHDGSQLTMFGVAFAYGLSADGRYVVFGSPASNVVPGDTNNATDIFVRDVVAGTTARANLTDADAEIHGGSYDAGISGNGRFVVFSSDSPDLLGGSGLPHRVFVRDLRAGTTEPVSVGVGGVAPNGDSAEPAISADGRFVTFTSSATNLVSGSDTNDAQDVFVRDRVAGTTGLVSTAADDTAANADSVQPQISADGRSVAFLSDATDLSGGTGAGRTHVYRRDLDTALTRRVNVADSGAPVALYSTIFSLAAGGSLVAFVSAAPDVVAGDINGAPDVFVRDTSAPSTVLVSVATGGGQGRNCFWSLTDAVIGLPRYGSSAGAVHANLVSNAAKILTRDSLGVGPGSPGDRFGASVGVENLSGNVNQENGRGCADLVIGAPGAGPDHGGRVFIALNSVYGIGVGTPTVTVAPYNGVAGDDFGASVRLITTYSGAHERVWALFVGQPGREVRGVKDAGAVERFDLTYDRDTDQVTVVRRGPLTQGSEGVPGAAEEGDRFGEVLSTGYNAVLVGVPHEDIGTKKDAGMVAVVPVDPAAEPLNVSQDSAGIPGAAEAGDLFGAALGGMGCEALVGAPGEDVGSIRDAGLAQWFSVRPCVTKDLAAGPSRTQDSPGVPGAAEAGDRFGAAVMSAQGGENQLTVIGAPGEDVGTRADAGLLLFEDYCTDDPSCPAKLVYQGHGMSGSPEPGDQLGAALAVRVQNTGDNTTYGVLVGVPGEDIGTVVDAGVVYDGFDAGLVHDGSGRTIQPPGGPITGLRYGAVIGDNHN